MEYLSVNLKKKFDLFTEAWSPKIIASLNDYEVKLARLDGEFVWHDHPDTDELFLCLEGSMKILFRDGQVELEAGEMFVVPKGTEHMPVADTCCKVLLIEPGGVVNTGDTGGELTAASNQWI
jgi:mannose-6-phosphate isomerase-like protein (cupin superfamily)